ncbi:MAG TPA: Ig-like domain-containing protein, partial [Rubrobacteraceae bacterium]|nr:Ig-like domain-containing protein [Rubrobacteraceae bacterium]
ELVFSITGVDSSREIPATTDEDGVAAVELGVTERPGAYDLAVRYAGQTDEYEGSADLQSLEVAREDTDTVLTVNGNGSNRTLRARVSDRDAPSVGVAGVVVGFFSNGTLVGTATTNGDGVATLEATKKTSGNRDFTAVFEGDDYFRTSQGHASG